MTKIVNNYNHYKVRSAETINADLERLPIGEMVKLKDATSGATIPTFRGVKVITNPLDQFKAKVHYVGIPTEAYELVQHAQAFKGVVEAMTLAGIDNFKYCLWSTPKKASLNVFIGGEGYDGVKIGFNMTNSLDGHSTLKYGLKVDQYTNTLELVGYRQVCSNGMKVKVPLDEAEIIKPEVVTRVKELIAQNTALTHTESINPKLEAINYVTEAVSLLKAPIEAMIKKAEGFTIDDKAKLEALIKVHVGKRFKSKVLDAYANENNNAWGLYNAITYVASHDNDIKESARETLKDKAAELLLATASSRGA